MARKMWKYCHFRALARRDYGRRFQTVKSLFKTTDRLFLLFFWALFSFLYPIVFFPLFIVLDSFFIQPSCYSPINPKMNAEVHQTAPRGRPAGISCYLLLWHHRCFSIGIGKKDWEKRSQQQRATCFLGDGSSESEKATRVRGREGADK